MRNRSFFLLLLLPIVAACDISGTNSGSGGGGPTTTQLTELSRAFTDDIESGTATLTASELGSPNGFDFAGACPDSSNASDADADGILDDATLTYAGAACRQASWRGGVLAVSGEVEVTDHSQSNNTSYDLHLTDLTWAYTSTTEALSYIATRNGTRLRRGSSDSIEVISVDTTDRQRPVITAVAHVMKDLTWTFGADDDGAVHANLPLPSGRLTVEGTYHWKRSSEDWDLDITTPTRLQYDATCTEPQRITAGSIELAGDIAGFPGILTITWAGCGEEPTRVWTAD